MEITVTRFKGVSSTEPVEETSLASVLDEIRSSKWERKIKECMADISKKRWLPCFTPTGRFTHRSIAGLYGYNGVVCLDVDHLPDPETVKAICKTLPWCHAAFITPSYKGLKVIVLTNATKETHTVVDLEVARLFREVTGVSRDEHCKDIARIQFVSWDPNLYYNPASEVLVWDGKGLTAFPQDEILKV
jgi:hypothetical protein